MSAMRISPLVCGVLFGTALAIASTPQLHRIVSSRSPTTSRRAAATSVGADMFDKKLKELSGARSPSTNILAPSSAPKRRLLQKVQTGDIDFVFLSTANASTAQPESGVFSIHFIFRDEGHMPSKCLATPP